MFCPECGQERISQVTSFCSRCGFLLTGTAELRRTGGAPLLPAEDTPSPRSRGIKSGLFIFLLTFLVAPILGMLSVFALGMRPWPMGIAVFLLGGGGLLRIAYALMFESRYPLALPAGDGLQLDEQPALERITPNAFLHPQRDLAASEYASPRAGRWLDTNDLEPLSVTDSTTKLLEKNSDPPV
jgi:hypothetical protein